VFGAAVASTTSSATVAALPVVTATTASAGVAVGAGVTIRTVLEPAA
jgi:hypothetical protein